MGQLQEKKSHCLAWKHRGCRQHSAHFTGCAVLHSDALIAKKSENEEVSACDHPWEHPPAGGAATIRTWNSCLGLLPTASTRRARDLHHVPDPMLGPRNCPNTCCITVSEALLEKFLQFSQRTVISEGNKSSGMLQNWLKTTAPVGGSNRGLCSSYTSKFGDGTAKVIAQTFRLLGSPTRFSIAFQNYTNRQRTGTSTQ